MRQAPCDRCDGPNPPGRFNRPSMAGAALGFSECTLQVHQVLAVRPTARHSSGFPLRPDWEPAAHLPGTTPR